MALSLAQMQSSQDVGPPEESMLVCLAQKVAREVREIEAELRELAPALSEEGEREGPARIGDPATVRVAELEARKAPLLEKMREHTGRLGFRAIEGEWRRWADAHPPRVDSRDEGGAPIYNPQDVEHAYGLVDVSALREVLETYATDWDGEPLKAGQWAFIIKNAAPGDLWDACRLVVRLHEGPGTLPKSLRPLPVTPPVATD